MTSRTSSTRSPTTINRRQAMTLLASSETPVSAVPMGTYKKMEKPAVEGERRSRSWRTMEWGVDPMLSETWKQRAMDYWLLQGATYGLKFDRFILAGCEYEGMWVITTWSVV